MINVFRVNSEQFNASLLNKSLYIFLMLVYLMFNIQWKWSRILNQWDLSVGGASRPKVTEIDINLKHRDSRYLVRSLIGLEARGFPRTKRKKNWADEMKLREIRAKIHKPHTRPQKHCFQTLSLSLGQNSSDPRWGQWHDTPPVSEVRVNEKQKRRCVFSHITFLQISLQLMNKRSASNISIKKVLLFFKCNYLFENVPRTFRSDVPNLFEEFSNGMYKAGNVLQTIVILKWTNSDCRSILLWLNC